MKKKKTLVVAIASVLTILISINAIIKILEIRAEETDIQQTTNEAARAISLQSDGYSEENGEPGSWHIEKSAEWTAIDKAKLTFDVKSIRKIENENYKDVLLVLDISGSMEGDKLAKVKSDSIGLVEYLLSNSNNKVGLIVYSDNAETKIDFTNNKNTVINQIKLLSDGGNTNYNDPLKHVDSIMKNYTKQSDRDVVTLFLTDGYPNVDTPNQVATYQILKSKYPYMEINGVQYEMGEQIRQEIIDISDKQWIANIRTLENVLFDATYTLAGYDKFEVEDLIKNEYFTIETIEDIEVTSGTIDLTEENETQKIIWTLDNSKTGIDAQMNVNVTLKEQYEHQEGYFPTNKETKVVYNLEDEEESVKQTQDTPILRMQEYLVLYAANLPEEKIVTGMPENESHYPFEIITKSQEEPICEGWNFKGWEIVEEVKNINEDCFIMPTNNVTIRAIWGKQEILKSMDGKVVNANLPKVGDTVHYSPSGTYDWSDGYSNISGTNTTTISSEEGESFRITEWKILNIDDETGNVEIVPASSPSGKLRLFGAQGYNNAVYLLNNACSNLYSDESKGIIARSINMDDIEKVMKEEGNESSIVAPTQINGQYSLSNSVYPVIYGQEKLSTINSSGTLGLSDQTRLIERSEGTKSDGSIASSTRMTRPYDTNYEMDYNDFTNALGSKANLILPNESSTSYWVASRCVATDSDSCYFRVRCILGGELRHGTSAKSSTLTVQTGGRDNLFPIVSLNSELLEPEGNGVFGIE